MYINGKDRAMCETQKYIVRGVFGWILKWGQRATNFTVQGK